MKKYLENNPEGLPIFTALSQRSRRTPDGEAARRLLDALEPWERHGPLRADDLESWKREVPYHGGSTYGKLLERDIRFAEECNRNGCEMIVSFKRA